ncbi:MAG: flavodoxin family protein [Clostridiaceae bacterium]|nr:flavodoxin family protein [Clostridiaceae bacterium]
MRVLVLTDIDDSNSDYINFNALINALSQSGIKPDIFFIKKEIVKPCVSCYSCWIKSPGSCRIKDSIDNLSKLFFHADLFIIFARIDFGCYSAEIKKCLERLIPNMLPFFEERQNKMYHAPRYRKYPEYIMIGYAEHISEEEKKLFAALTSLNAVNMHRDKHRHFIIEKNQTIDFHKLLNNSLIKL